MIKLNHHLYSFHFLWIVTVCSSDVEPNDHFDWWGPSNTEELSFLFCPTYPNEVANVDETLNLFVSLFTKYFLHFPTHFSSISEPSSWNADCSLPIDSSLQLALFLFPVIPLICLQAPWVRSNPSCATSYNFQQVHSAPCSHFQQL